MAHLMVCTRITPGVEARQRVHAERLEMPASVQTGAGDGVSSTVWLRDNDLDAHGVPRRSFWHRVERCGAGSSHGCPVRPW